MYTSEMFYELVFFFIIIIIWSIAYLVENYVHKVYNKTKVGSCKRGYISLIIFRNI